MKIFMDSEFTGLHQNTTLISIGIVDELGRTFYAECGDFDRSQVDDWIEENVIKNLKFHGNPTNTLLWESSNTININEPTEETTVYGSRWFVMEELTKWLERIGTSEKGNLKFWSDTHPYDWVLFCELWGGAMNIPEIIYYIPFDIVSLFDYKGIDPDINREDFANLEQTPDKHNALWDAQVIKQCYNNLMLIP